MSGDLAEILGAAEVEGIKNLEKTLKEDAFVDINKIDVSNMYTRLIHLNLWSMPRLATKGTIKNLLAASLGWTRNGCDSE